MVKISVIQCTRRKEPHFQWALETLKEQTFPHNDFEYLIVDGLYDQRKEQVLKIIKDSNVDFPVLYLKDKPSRWKGKRPALCNARNTGLIFASGEYICFHDDNCRLDSRWLERHAMWMEKGYIVAGNWMSYKDITKEVYHGWEYRSTVLKQPTEISGGWLYGGNFGFPIKAADDVNGFDEYLDGEMGQDDISFGLRAQRKGYKIMYDPQCYLEYYYANHGSLMRYKTKLQQEVEFDVPPVNIKLKDGIEHFSNEFAIQELLEDREKFWTKGNTINMRGSREIWKSGVYSMERMYEMMESWVDGNPIDWRDGKLIADKIKEMEKK